MTRRVTDQVDGLTIDEHAGTITGTFEVDLRDINELGYDSEVMLVITARAKLPRFKEAANGDLTRVAVLRVKEARVVKNPEQVDELADQFGFEFNTPLPMPGPGITTGLTVTLPREIEDEEDETPEVEDENEDLTVIEVVPRTTDDALREFLDTDTDSSVTQNPYEVERKDKALAEFLYS